MSAQVKIDQVGLPAGVAGKSRTNGLATGAVVTLTNTGSGSTTRFRFVWVPPDDTAVLGTLIQTGPKVWTFTPGVNKFGSYLVELIEDEGLPTEKRERRVFGVRTALLGALIPALNERGDPTASLLAAGAAQIEAADNNADDYAEAALNTVRYAAWWRAHADLVKRIEAIVPSHQSFPVVMSGLVSDFALPAGFRSGDTLMVQLTGDCIVDGIAAPPGGQPGFEIKWVMYDSTGAGSPWKMIFRDIDFSVSNPLNGIRTPHETDGGTREGPDFILGPSEEEAATLVYGGATSLNWRITGSTWQPLIRRFDNTHSPLVRYDFDRSLVDLSGNGRDLTGTGQVFREVWPGIFGLVGGSAARTVHDAALTLPGDVTLLQLCVMRAVPAAAGVVTFSAAGGVEAGNAQYQIRLTDQDNPDWFSQHGVAITDSFASAGDFLPQLGVPFSLIGRRAANVVTFFANGRQVGAPSGALTTPTGGTTSLLAYRSFGTNPPELFGAKIVGSALTDAQIRAEHNRTLGAAFGYV